MLGVLSKMHICTIINNRYKKSNQAVSTNWRLSLFYMTRRCCIVAILCVCLQGCNKAPTPLENFKAPFYYGPFELPSDNLLNQESVILGRKLFYETKLSLNNKISCASCHQQAKAFTDGHAFAIGVSGNPIRKSSMSLNNLLWGPRHFFWDGRSATLEEQALIPIQNPEEMGLTLTDAIAKLKELDGYPLLFKDAFGSDEITAEKIAKALASFQRTLISQNSKYDKFLKGELKFSDEELLGKQLFSIHPDPEIGLRGGNCGDCHSQFLTSGFSTGFDGFKNNGLDSDEKLEEGLAAVTKNKADRGKFKVPSLRNIALTAPYMHDGRFKTLEEVLDHYDRQIQNSSSLDPLMKETSNNKKINQHKLGFYMTEKEKKAIIAFLKTLTDEEFITKKEFSDPNK